MLDRHRKSTVISSQQAEAIVWAVLLAYSRNLHLNAWLTINLDKIHIPRGQARAFLTQFKKMVGDCLRKRSGMPLSYVGVFENPGQFHLHAHFLLHVPAHLISDFRKHQKGWLERCGATLEVGEPYLRFLCRCNPSAVCDCLEVIGEKVIYILKGADPKFCTTQNIEHVPQGEILGKRHSISQTLYISPALGLAPNERAQ
jgi:hypothetical protein